MSNSYHFNKKDFIKIYIINKIIKIKAILLANMAKFNKKFYFSFKGNIIKHECNLVCYDGRLVLFPYLD